MSLWLCSSGNTLGDGVQGRAEFSLGLDEIVMGFLGELEGSLK